MPNDWLLTFDLGAWKPVLTALLLPPASLLVPMLAGAWLLRRRPAAMWVCLLAGSAALWLGSTLAAGRALQRSLLPSFPALAPADIQALRRGGGGAAIVVLGGGREAFAPEYAGATLSDESIARLRYGLWLARQTGLPVAFSGGVGHAAAAGPAEAEIAAEIAAREFGRPLRWVEAASRDTRENAAHSVALLRAEGVRRIVLVTQGWHMARSVRAFEQAAQHQGDGPAIVPAPMALGEVGPGGALSWLPSLAGWRLTHLVLREWLGLLAGA